MRTRLGALTTIAAVATALLMVFVLPLGTAAAASPELTPGPAYTLWAYGVVRTVDFSGSSAQGYSYQGNATYGYSVILDQTNFSHSFEISANRTIKPASRGFDRLSRSGDIGGSLRGTGRSRSIRN